MLGAGNKIGEDVAALRPGFRPLDPFVEVIHGIAGLDLVLRAHQSCVSEIGCSLVDLRKILVVRKRAARMGRNPATGEPIQIKASKKVAFRAAKELKEAV